jgi:hypothetical protein
VVAGPDLTNAEALSELSGTISTHHNRNLQEVVCEADGSTQAAFRESVDL